jgi:carbamoylphosphate synthase large subunit
MTDPGMADRTYIGPMTPEYAEQILAKVRRPEPKAPVEAYCVLLEIAFLAVLLHTS